MFNFRRGGPDCPLPRGLHILPMLLALLLAMACTRSGTASGVVVTDKQIAPQPVQIGSIAVSFRLNKEGNPLTGAHVSLEGDMTHAGMAPVFGEAHEVAPGRYQGRLSLNMAGDWVVLLHITLPDGHNLEDQMNVSGVQNK